MAFNVDKFISNLSKFGTLQTNKFEVELSSVPEGLRGNYNSSFLNLLMMRTRDVRLPGYVLDTFESRRYGIGPSEKVATNVRFEPISLSFIETSEGEISKFFYDWSNYIFGTSDSYNRNNVYKTEYRQKYIVDKAIIRIYNNNGNKRSESYTKGKASEVLKIELREVFPISVSDNDLSWDNNNTLFRVNVGLAFTYFQKNIDQRAIETDRTQFGGAGQA